MTPNETSLKQTRLERLQSLKLRKEQSIIANREALLRDSRKNKLLLIQVRKEKQEENKAEEKVYEKPTEEDQRKKNLTYTIKQSEDWEISKPNQVSKAGANFNELAEQAYKKTIKNLNVDKESYQSQMKLLNQKYNLDNLDDIKRLQVLVSQNPADIDKELLVSMINQSKQNAGKRKRNAGEELNVDSFINEKNRQFNMKLNRQYNSS